MRLAFAAMEDLGHRTGALGLGKLCAGFGTDQDGNPHAFCDPRDIMTSADEIRTMDAPRLAEIDAFFVDFDLQSSKVPGSLRWKPLRLRSGTEFVPATGMSTLLWLRDIMESGDYRRHRERYLAGQTPEHRRWVGPTGRTRLFSFVEVKDVLSQLYAAAADAWFGATYLNAQIDFSDPEQLKDAVWQMSGDPSEYLRRNHLARWYAEEGGRLLDRVLIDDKFRGEGQRLIPPGTAWPSNFDLYRIYLKHSGTSNFGTYDDPQGFREAFFEITGIVIPPHPKRLLGEPTKRFFGDLQNSLDEFRGAADPNAREWDEWAKDGFDPLYDYLSNSKLFWQAEDVRVAFEEHVRRRGQA